MEIKNLSYNAKESMKRRSSLKRILLSSLVVLLLSSSGLYAYLALHKPLPDLVITTNSLATIAAESVSLAWPSYGQAAIGSLEEGVLAKSSEVEQARPTASMAKVITALAVMKQKPFEIASQGATITLDQTDRNFYDSYVARGGSVGAVTAGEQLTQYQALELMLLPSANNMADSLARWAFGSVDNYITYANTMIKAMGLKQTTVADASGFSASTTSTPSELVILGQQALLTPVIAKIVSEVEAIVPVAGTIRNTNQLLTTSKASGIKTGHTQEAGNCLLFAASYVIDDTHKTTVIGVIMGGPSAGTVFSSADSLLTSAYQRFGARQVIAADAVVGSYSSAWKAKVDIKTTEPLTHYGWKGVALIATPSIKPNRAPLASNSGAGSIIFKVMDNETSVELVTESELPKPNILWRLTHYF